MKIVRVTRRQLHEVDSHLRPESRRIIRELTISNLYLQMENVLLVAEDDVELCTFPKGAPISIASIVTKSILCDELKFGFTGFKEREDKPYHTNIEKHEFVDRHSAADNSCLTCDYPKEDLVHNVPRGT